MSSNRSINIGGGIVKQSARPIKFLVDGSGEYWICDAGVDPKGDLGAQGCVAHSSVHLVK
ncbi:MAG: hypothetical protein AMS21_07700 [Gemmatimonas sp. SG8_38_2]|nr:MAG: hypothetical protein AMS21_07700 [Gemmatimonas sp. SG8_38_2]